MEANMRVVKTRTNLSLQKRFLLVAAAIVLFAGYSATPSYADTVTEYFNLTCPGGNCGPGLTAPTVVAPVGEITFTLNLDQTIAASLWDYGLATVSGFGFNSAFVNLPESGWAPGTPDNFIGWGDDFGYQYSGFGSYVTHDVPLQESWTIDGTYNSVWDVLNNPYSSVNFFLTDSNGNWGAGPTSPAVPEPGSLLLLGTGVVGLAGALRRKLAH
jgi:hypothetical protein